MADSASAQLPIIGVCRFSYLGFSDWRSNHGDRRGRTDDQVIEDNRKILFLPDRLEQRFATFEALTVPSLAAQTDKDFRFVVLTSDELPKPYADRLVGLAKKHPFMHVVFAPVARAKEKFTETYAGFGYQVNQILQFRLDDDDAVGRNYIRRMRQLGDGFHNLDRGRAFAITFPNVLMVTRIDGKLTFRRRHFPHTAAGQAMFHPTRNVMDWAHHEVDRHVISISEWYDQWVLQTFLTGVNDSGEVNEAVLRGRGAQIAPDQLVDEVLSRHFPFAQRDEEWWQRLGGAA